MEYIVSSELKDYKFIPTYKYGKYFISLDMTEGSMSTNLIYFERCMTSEFFEDNKDMFYNLLIQFLEKPELFLEHWLKVKELSKIKVWVNSMKFNGFEFRLQDGNYSGSFHIFYSYNNDRVIELSKSFKSYINSK